MKILAIFWVIFSVICYLAGFWGIWCLLDPGTFWQSFACVLLEIGYMILAGIVVTVIAVLGAGVIMEW